jgi:hypothetical protein
MRLVPLLLLLAMSSAQAQPEVDETLAPFAFMVGQWAGPAWLMTPDGERQPLHQTERVQPMLGGTILLIEGTGREGGPEGAIVFQAVGILSYDADADQYYLDAFRDGRHVRAEMTSVAHGAEWGFDVGGRQIRNVMRLEDGRWYETSDVVLENGSSFRVVEFTLERVSDEP